MVRIRLRRMGSKHRPAYRVVIADARAPRDGKFIETIGHYNPQLQPKVLVIKQDRARYWLGVGAQPSDTVVRLFKNVGVLDGEGKVTEAVETSAPVVEAPAPAKPRRKAAAPAAEAAAPVAAAPAAAPYGAGSAASNPDGSAPEGFAIKGNDSSKLYHVPGSRYYDSTIAEIWFATPEDAERAGFSAPGSKA